jgi:hypothetical protein
MHKFYLKKYESILIEKIHLKIKFNKKGLYNRKKENDQPKFTSKKIIQIEY